MALSRNVTQVINYFLDNICPPILRDCYWLMYPIYWAAYKKDTAKLLRYKENFPFLDEKGYSEYYEIAARTPLSQRSTDLNKAGIKFVLSHIKSGDKVLEAGCGRGFMAREMQKITPPQLSLA